MEDETDAIRNFLHRGRQDENDILSESEFTGEKVSKPMEHKNKTNSARILDLQLNFKLKLMILLMVIYF